MNKFISDLLEKYPSLTIKEYNEKYTVLIGELVLNHEYKNISIYKELNVEVIIPYNYPEKLPEIHETGRLLEEKYHINNTGSLCLGTEIDVRWKLAPDYLLSDWIEKLVFPFFYSYFYYKSYQVSPFGERSHFERGILESIQEFFKLKNMKETYIFIKNFSRRKYKRMIKYKKSLPNHFCPCGSGKKIHNCHKKELSDYKFLFRKYETNFIENLEEIS